MRRISDKLSHMYGREWAAVLTPSEALALARESGIRLSPSDLKRAEEDSRAGRGGRSWVYVTRD
jgi:hypothetical protein